MSKCKDDNRPALDRPKLPPITSLPEDTWDAVDDYLRALIDQCHYAACRSSAAAKIDPTGCFAANADYWRHARGAFRWFRGQLRRQRTLHERRSAKAGGGR